ncbi:MAG: hypothetical protein K0U78_20220 [Actinomycetia bacterium]|nr:hypothetical protein [Actinomycetes bacterium]
MSVGTIALPDIVFCFPNESMAQLQRRWTDWVDRDATVTTCKDQAEDTAGVSMELLRTRMILRPTHTPLVIIAEPQLESAGPQPGQLLFKPFLPWNPLPVCIGARLAESDPDTIWLIPRMLTVADFPNP